jgi:ribosome-binding protein aMBF1 (putative translation factor)
MSAPSRSEKTQALTRELPHAFTASSPVFDRELAAKIGKHIAVRRSLCGLSKQQLAARLGVDPMEVETYERGERRMNCKLLLETAKQLKATPRFFFQ